MPQHDRIPRRAEMLAATYEPAKQYVEAYEAWRERYRQDGQEAATEEIVDALQKMLSLAASCSYHLRRNPAYRAKVEQAVKRAGRG